VIERQGILRHINPRHETVRQGTENRRSGRASLVAMMKPSRFWNLDNPTLIGRLHFSGFWRILVQGEVTAGIVIVLDKRSKRPTE
jgi:hypothetical protein